MRRVDDVQAHRPLARRGPLIRALLVSMVALGLVPVSGLSGQDVQGIWTAGLRVGWAEDDRGLEGLALGPTLGAGVKLRHMDVFLQGALDRGVAVGAGNCAEREADDVIIEHGCDATLTSVALVGQYARDGGMRGGQFLIGGRLGVESYRSSTGPVWGLFAGSGLAQSPVAFKVTYDHAEPADRSGFGFEVSISSRR